MSENLDPIVTTGTFGTWITRTNEIITELQTTVQLGGSATNASGNLYINGDISSSANLNVDVINKLDSGLSAITFDTGLTADGDITTTGVLVLGSGSAGSPSSIQLRDGTTNTWSIETTTSHAELDIKKGTKYLRIDTGNSEITGNGLTISSTILPDSGSISEGTNKYFTDARAVSAIAGAIKTGSDLTYDADGNGKFDIAVPDVPVYRGTANEVDVTADSENTGDFIISLAQGLSTTDDVQFGDVTANDIILEDSKFGTNGVAYIKGSASGSSPQIQLWAKPDNAAAKKALTIAASGHTTVENNLYVADDTYVSDVKVRDGSNTTISFTASSGSIIAEGDITAFGDASERHLKENIEVIPNALEKVSAITGYTFNYIGNEERLSGVIVDEIEPVLPEVVYTANKQSRTKAVRYGNIVPLLIEAIKELQAQVEELKEKR